MGYLYLNINDRTSLAHIGGNCATMGASETLLPTTSYGVFYGSRDSPMGFSECTISLYSFVGLAFCYSFSVGL